jgi:hypothetical protein
MKFPGTTSHFSGRRERFAACPGKALGTAVEFAHRREKENRTIFRQDSTQINQ